MLAYHCCACSQMLVFYEPAHDKTHNKTCAKSELRSACAFTESSLIACAFYNLLAVQRGIKWSPCDTGRMYRLIWFCWSHRFYCRFCRALAHIWPFYTFVRFIPCHVDTISSSPTSEVKHRRTRLVLRWWPPGNIVAIDLVLFLFLFFFKPNCSRRCIPETSHVIPL